MNFFKNLFNKKPSISIVDITKRFDLISEMGQGTMSKVWKALDTQDNRMVALKILDKELSHQLNAKFANLERPKEGEIALAIPQHPNIVTTLEHGLTLQSEQFLVMELIEGISLNIYIDRQNEDMQKYRLQWLVQLGEAIEHIHKNGWIHRDICPHNVMVTKEKQLKLIDFGLTVPNTAPFRSPGNRTGKPTYMAPELMKRHETDQRLDIFSYAVTCYECYTSHLPWKSGDSIKEALKSLSQPPVHIQKFVPELDDNISQTIMRGLKRDANQRWKSAQAMMEQFSRSL